MGWRAPSAFLLTTLVVGATVAAEEAATHLTLALEKEQIQQYTDADLRSLFELYLKDFSVQKKDGRGQFENFRQSVGRVLKLRLEALEGPQREQFGLNKYSHFSPEELTEVVPTKSCGGSCDDNNYLNLLNKEFENDKEAAKAWKFISNVRRVHSEERTSFLSGAEGLKDPPIPRFHYRRKLEKNLNLPPTEWPEFVVNHSRCLTPVRVQHPPLAPGCGSCWSHGSVGALEVPLCVAKQNSTVTERNSKVDFSDEDESHRLSLSVQELLDCTSENNNTSTVDHDVRNHGCRGGDLFTTWNSVMSTGLRSQDAFPGKGDHYDLDSYTRCISAQATYEPALYPKWGQPGMFRFAGYRVYPNVSDIVWSDDQMETLWPQNSTQVQEYIKKGVRQAGAVSAAVLTKIENFMAWRNWTDIYYPDMQECVGAVDKFGKFGQITNHQVPIVGYGEDRGRKFFWIKNSWGAEFGDNGYYRVSADHCQRFVGPLGPGEYFKLPTVAFVRQD